VNARRERQRQRVQAAALLIVLTASAGEIWAVAAGFDGLRDGLLVLIALTMLAAAAAG